MIESFKVCMTSDIPRIIHLLDAGAAIDDVSDFGASCLHTAVG